MKYWKSYVNLEVFSKDQIKFQVTHTNDNLLKFTNNF